MQLPAGHGPSLFKLIATPFKAIYLAWQLILEEKIFQHNI